MAAARDWELKGLISPIMPGRDAALAASPPPNPGPAAADRGGEVVARSRRGARKRCGGGPCFRTWNRSRARSRGTTAGCARFRVRRAAHLLTP